jgi:hypothetical protein
MDRTQKVWSICFNILPGLSFNCLAVFDRKKLFIQIKIIINRQESSYYIRNKYSILSYFF